MTKAAAQAPALQNPSSKYPKAPFRKQRQQWPEEKLHNFGSHTVFGRPGQPAELASIYVLLAADDASFATGNIYGAGGGQGQP